MANGMIMGDCLRYDNLELTELKARDASCPKGKKMR